MVKIKKKTNKKKKEKITENDTVTYLGNDEISQNKFKEVLTNWGIGIFWIVLLISIFSGFKYPWKWIDALYETEKEKLESINSTWNNIYTPLIQWCATNTAPNKSIKAIGKKKMAYKDYLITLSGDERKCLENKDFRIELINKPLIDTKENEILNKWFNELPSYVKKFEISIENNTKFKKERFIIKTNQFYWEDILEMENEDFSFRNRNQILCGYYENIGYAGENCYFRNIFYTENSENDSDIREKIFIVEFLSVVDFILLSKACLNGCIAEITYLDGIKNRIRAINILNPILKTWPKYSEKNAREIKEYDSMINKTFFLANEFEKKHSKPSWFENIVIQ